MATFLLPYHKPVQSPVTIGSYTISSITLLGGQGDAVRLHMFSLFSEEQGRQKILPLPVIQHLSVESPVHTLLCKKRRYSLEALCDRWRAG